MYVMGVYIKGCSHGWLAKLCIAFSVVLFYALYLR